MMKSQEQVTVGGVKHTFRKNADGSFTYKAGEAAPKKLTAPAAAQRLDALRAKRVAQDRKAATAKAKAAAVKKAAAAKKAVAKKAVVAKKAAVAKKPVAAKKPVVKKVVKKK